MDRRVLWVCDAMHGNRVVTDAGVRTCRFDGRGPAGQDTARTPRVPSPPTSGAAFAHSHSLHSRGGRL
jgi:hypothetical protein